MDAVVYGVAGGQEPRHHGVVLADAVDPPEALFDAVGVPGKVVVDHQVGALEVDPLAGGVGGDENDDILVVDERLLYLPSLLTG